MSVEQMRCYVWATAATLACFASAGQIGPQTCRAADDPPDVSTVVESEQEDFEPTTDNAVQEAKALIRPQRIDGEDAVAWLVGLTLFPVVVMLLVLFLRVRYFTPRVATQHFDSHAGPATGDKRGRDPLARKYDIPADRAIDDADFPI